MNHFDKDTVLNFLTPTKLVTTSTKAKAQYNPPLYDSSRRSNLNNSNSNIQSGASSRQLQPNTQLPTYSFTAQFDKLGGDRSQEGSRGYLNDRSKVPSEKNQLDSSRPNLSKGNSSKAIEEVRQPSKNPSYSAFQTQTLDYAPVGEVLAKINLSNSNSRAREDESYSRVKDEGGRVKEGSSWGREVGGGSRARGEGGLQSREDNRNVYKLEGTSEELQKLMVDLRGVRAKIDEELHYLQRLLDNTSNYLNKINQEYMRIKERILRYTSQVLDASFRKYQERKADWAKYEKVQKAAITMLTQLDKAIIEDDIVIREIERSPAPRIAIAKQQQISQQIHFYSGFHQELTSYRQQCMSMYPTLKKEKIYDYEKALTAMAEF